MKFSDCVLNFIFFMCSLVVSMEIHYYCVFGRTFDHYWSPCSLLSIYGHHRSSPTLFSTLQPIFFVPFWPTSAYITFGHEHIAQIYSVHVLTFRAHIFTYMLSSNPCVDSNERACSPLYVHSFLPVSNPLCTYHTIAISKAFWRFQILCVHFIHLVHLGLWAKSPCSLTLDLPNVSTLGI